MEQKIKYYFMCRLSANEKPSTVRAELNNLLLDSSLIPNEFVFKNWENELNHSRVYKKSLEQKKFYALCRHRLGVPVHRIISEMRIIFELNAPSFGLVSTWLENDSPDVKLFHISKKTTELNSIQPIKTELDSLMLTVGNKLNRKFITSKELEQAIVNLIEENSNLKDAKAKMELKLNELLSAVSKCEKEAENEKKNLKLDYDTRMIALNLEKDELIKVNAFLEEKTKSQVNEICELKYKLISRRSLDQQRTSRQTILDSISDKENLNSNDSKL